MLFRRKTSRNQELNLPGSAKKRRRKRIIVSIVIAVLVIIVSYLGYLIASGKRIFDPASLTGSAFFKSGQNHQLKGEGDGRINILLMGMGGESHPGGTLTDTIIVMSIDPKAKTMAMLSIPRDLYVPVPGTKYSKKINEIYSTGEERKKGDGPILAKETVSKILDLPIHYYLTVDFYAFKKIIDEIGGVDVLVDKDLYDPLYPADDMVRYQTFKIKAGQQHLDGATALKFARSRETTSDFDRAARQQKVITAAREKILKVGFLANPKKILDMVNILGDHARTDFSPKEIYALSTIISELDMGKTVSKVLTNGTDGELVSDSSTGTYTLRPIGGTWEKIQRIAHEIFTDSDLKEEDAKIEVLNGSKTVGLALKLSDILQSYNYNVIKTDNAAESFEKTVIFDYSNGSKKVTLQFLKARLNCEVQKKDRPVSGADITIVIGNDYKGFNKDLN